MTQIS